MTSMGKYDSGEDDLVMGIFARIAGFILFIYIAYKIIERL